MILKPLEKADGDAEIERLLVFQVSIVENFDNPNWHMWKSTFLSVHRKECKKYPLRSCPCKNLHEEPTRLQGFKMIEAVLIDLRSKHQKSTVILRYLLYINLYRLQNLFQAALLHQFTMRQKHSLQEAITLFKLGEIIAERLEWSYENPHQSVIKDRKILKVAELLDYENGFSMVKEKMIQLCLTKESMLNELEFVNSDVKEVVDKASRFIFKQSKMIRNQYNRLIHLKNTSPPLLILYCYFNSMVLNLKSEAKKTLMKLQNMKDEMARKQRIKSDSENHDMKGIVSISMEPGRCGDITLVDQYALNMLQYSKDELVGKNLNLILPEFLAKKHNNFLAHFGKSPESSVVNKKRLLFFIDKGGFLIPMILNVKLHFDQDKGIELVATLFEFKQLERYQPKNKLLYYLSYNQITGDVGYVCKNSAQYLGF